MTLGKIKNSLCLVAVSALVLGTAVPGMAQSVAGSDGANVSSSNGAASVGGQTGTGVQTPTTFIFPPGTTGDSGGSVDTGGTTMPDSSGGGSVSGGGQTGSGVQTPTTFILPPGTMGDSGGSVDTSGPVVVSPPAPTGNNKTALASCQARKSNIADHIKCLHAALGGKPTGLACAVNNPNCNTLTPVSLSDAWKNCSMNELYQAGTYSPATAQ